MSQVNGYQSKRLNIRPFTKAIKDFEFLCEIGADIEVVKYLGDGNTKSREDCEKLLNKLLSEYEKFGRSIYAIELNETNELIGRGGLIPWNIDGELQVRRYRTLLRIGSTGLPYTVV